MPYLIQETNDRHANITAHIFHLGKGRLWCGAKPSGETAAVYQINDAACTSNLPCRNCARLAEYAELYHAND